MLQDLGDNLERNINLVRNGIDEIKSINRSSQIIIQFIEDELPYSDSLQCHFGQVGRSGSYIVQLNQDGYESFKKVGFDILTSKRLKNELLTLFEISYNNYDRVIEVANEIWASDFFWWEEYFVTTLDTGMIPID